MSLFLGKIHHWLYNKILRYEALEAEIIERARLAGTEIDAVVSRINSAFGPPTSGQPLDEVVDTSNIHGWLQERIESAELRQAALTTELLKQNPEYKADILDIYTAQGRNAAKEYQGVTESPEDVFKALNDFILEGMPCDRVSLEIDNTEREYTWETTRCLHQPHWTRVGGDVQNFYDFRNAWIRAFVETINDKLTYEKTDEGLNKIYQRK